MRLQGLDILRGIAIIPMVIFHLNYSLVNIFSIEILNFSDIFWCITGKIAAILFILIAGFSFFLSEEKSPEKIMKKYLNYSILLGIIALSISFFTYIFYPEQYIRFGIIHFFSIGFFLLIFLRKLGYFNLLLGLTILIYGSFFISIVETQYLYFLGFMYPGFVSADYYPLFPYFGVLLMGYSLGKLFHSLEYDLFLKIDRELNVLELFLIYLGKKSLIIYLVHQPVIIGVLYFFKRGGN